VKETDMTTHTYRVTGMTCEHCVAAVTEELTALDGVTSDVPPATRATVTDVTVDSAEPLDHDEIVRAVDEAGYALA
jgi:copper chaperone